MSSLSQSLGASLENLLHHLRERGRLLETHEAPVSPPPLTIAISRERGAGGSKVAAEVSRKTGWPVYGRELVDKISDDSGIRQELLQSIDESRPNWLAECLGAMSSKRQMSQIGYAIRMREILLALAGHGECIVLGRGAAQVMPPETTLRVRLVAPREYRIDQVARRFDLSHKDAEKRMDEEERGRIEFVNRYFHGDSADSHWYDLTIDTSRFQIPRCAELITTALAGRRELVPR